MKNVVIYTTRACPYCISAINALKNASIPYREVDISNTPEMREELHAKTGERTVPQVFVDDLYIGQDDELIALIRSGGLDN